MKGQLKSYFENRKVPFRRYPKDFSLNTKSKISSLIQIQVEQDLDLLVHITTQMKIIVIQFNIYQ